MKISLEWIRRYAPVEATPEEIERALTLIGFEVESTDRLGLPPLQNVVVGKVLKREQHPNADRLSYCSVEVGADQPANIVCGATNFKEGDCVPVALPGAELPGGFKIKVSKLRGVQSEGMMCSPRELGLGDDHEGLMILPADTTVGMSLNALYPDSDWVFDVEVTPNRPDCLSHLGMARELAAWFQVPLQYPEVFATDRPEEIPNASHLMRSVEVTSSDVCPFYQAYLLPNVKIGPSPLWLRKAIEAIGLRPINNIVDVTNFVLHETGQPLHAFDAGKIHGQKLIIRQAEKGEILTTLDGKKRELDEEITVIADADRPLVIAGIMGSEEAEVDDSTTDVVLEAAYFNPITVRKTSRRLALSTDSSYRFERGVDVTQIQFAALRAIDLIREVSEARFSAPIFTVGNFPDIGREIKISPDYIRKRLGFGPDDDTIKAVLQSLELNVRKLDSAEELTWAVEIPSFRGDLERPIDLVEEFLRVYGTDKIPEGNAKAVAYGSQDAPVYRFFRDGLSLLSRKGFNEAVNYTLRSEEDLIRWTGLEEAPNALRLENPLAQDQAYMRLSLIPGLLDVLKTNLNHKSGFHHFAEAGRVYPISGENGEIFEACAIAFVQWVPAEVEAWRKRERPDFFTGKRIALELFQLAGKEPSEASDNFQPIIDSSAWQQGHAGRVGSWQKKGEVTTGFISAKLLKSLDIPGNVLAGEIVVLPEALDKVSHKVDYKPVPPFPVSLKDISLLVDEDLPAARVKSQLASLASKTAVDGLSLEFIEIFDVYQGKGLADGKKSLAFSLAYRKEGGTPSDAEVGKSFKSLIDQLSSDGRFEVRGV